MKIAVSVESVHDLTKELLEKYDIKVIPYQINLADLSFKDGEYSTEEMFALVDKYNTLPKTTALNPVEYKEFFESLKKDYDAVVHICLSSGITSSCGNAIAAATELKDVFVVDSLALSTGIGLQAIYARELANAGVPAAEIAAKLNARRDKVQTSFVLERLDYMHKGGRCSSIALLGANLLKIRPRIVLKNGKMLSDKKYRGNMHMVAHPSSKSILKESRHAPRAFQFDAIFSASGIGSRCERILGSNASGQIDRASPWSGCISPIGANGAFRFCGTLFVLPPP